MALQRLEQRGWQTEKLYAARTTRLKKNHSEPLIGALKEADLLILSAPVYFDSLPALVLKGLDDAASFELVRKPALLPIVQCGFPESSHTRLALEILWHFAQQQNWPWAGHLALGGGGYLDGQNIDAHSRFTSLQTLFDEVAQALGGTIGVAGPVAASGSAAASLGPALSTPRLNLISWVF